MECPLESVAVFHAAAAIKMQQCTIFLDQTSIISHFLVCFLIDLWQTYECDS